MKKNKISTLQITRLAIQIIFFIFLPMLYINTFAGIRQIYIAIIKHNTSASELIPQLIEVAVILPFTIIMGRFFCGWMCGFGAFGDFIYKAVHKVFKINFKINEDADRVLKYVKYAVLAVSVIAIWTLNLNTFSTFSPWDVFGMVATVGKTPDFSYAIANLTIGFSLFILIIIGSAFIERFYCRYFCPLGAVFAITSKLKIAKIRKERTKCGNCRICTKNCAMGIPLYKYDVVNSGECIDCMQCVTACPRKNTTLTITGDDVRPLVASVAVVSTMTGLYYAGNLGVKAAGFNNTQVVSEINSSSKLYKDGTYEGSGTGFRNGTTTVSVVVKNGQISDITTVSTQDDGQFYDRAYNTVTQEIISSQATDVDAVSGATFSSRGIMEAVENALSNAKAATTTSSSASTSTDASSSQQQTDNSQAQTQTSSQESASAKYKDGIYEGTGTGFRNGTTKVSVVVKNGKISDITTVSYQDDDRFYNAAFNTVSQEIISNQSTSVDAVSGATYSSNGIMQAVEDALSQAK